MSAVSRGFDPERQAIAGALHRKRLWLARGRNVVLLAFIGYLILSGSRSLLDGIAAAGFGTWATAALFLLLLYAMGSLLDLPFAYVGGYRWEREVGLSAETLRSWLKDHVKSFLLGLGSTVGVGLVVLWLLQTLPGLWWLAAWGLGLLVSLGLGFVLPVFLVPLFYRSRPLSDVALRSRFEALAKRAGVPIIGVFELASSAKSRRSNAGVVGVGRTRRILITDTMLREFAAEEVESVLAHELGHQKFLDPIRGFVGSAGTSLVVLGVSAAAYAALHLRFGIAGLGDAAGLPLLAVLGALISLPLGPLGLWLSRRRERRADSFALNLTSNPTAFSAAMVKLHDKNLGVADPSRWDLWLHYTHPSGRERLEFARLFRPSS